MALISMEGKKLMESDRDGFEYMATFFSFCPGGGGFEANMWTTHLSAPVHLPQYPLCFTCSLVCKCPPPSRRDATCLNPCQPDHQMMPAVTPYPPSTRVTNASVPLSHSMTLRQHVWVFLLLRLDAGVWLPWHPDRRKQASEQTSAQKKCTVCCLCWRVKPKVDQ